jgi:predicted ATP-dependent protease
MLAQASHWATEAGADVVDRGHVERAIAERIHRSNLLEDKLDELVAEGVLVIEAEGQRVGEVNGVAVLDLGDHRFGRPMRVTATTGPGPGRVVSIDRETELSGSLHDKGFLIVRGYLQWGYGQDLPLSLGASLTFEQSYDEVQGDSAASAELYALLSSLADAPIDQGVAVTGSVNQHGQIQPSGRSTRRSKASTTSVGARA